MPAALITSAVAAPEVNIAPTHDQFALRIVYKTKPDPSVATRAHWKKLHVCPPAGNVAWEAFSVKDLKDSLILLKTHAVEEKG